MGRQILFHMLPEDCDRFLDFVRERDPVLVIKRDSNSAAVESVDNLSVRGNGVFCLWNRTLLSNLDREWIADPGYYRADEFELPILELSPSFKAKWNGKPALCQGRLYGVFEGKTLEFGRWYEALVRWIRRNLRSNPTSMGGYVGPGAYELYTKGGYLLPVFIPPRTPEWTKEIGKQDSARGRAGVAVRRKK